MKIKNYITKEKIKSYEPPYKEVCKIFDKIIKNKIKFYIYDNENKKTKVYIKNNGLGNNTFRIIRLDNKQLYGSYTDVDFGSIVGHCIIKCFIFKRIFSLKDEWEFATKTSYGSRDVKFFEPELIADKINALLKL